MVIFVVPCKGNQAATGWETVGVRPSDRTKSQLINVRGGVGLSEKAGT